jgi:hypothetical protein
VTDPVASYHREARIRRWWIAILFIVGSTLFGLGAVPYYSEAVGLRATAVTFFLGSLFFTSAAFLQYRESVDDLAAVHNAHDRRFWVWAPEPPRFGRLRCVCGGRVRRASFRRRVERGGVQPRHARRGDLLPHRGDPPPAVEGRDGSGSQPCSASSPRLASAK